MRMYHSLRYSQHMISNQVYNRIIQYGRTILHQSECTSIEGAEGCEEDMGLYFEYLNLLISKGADVNCSSEVG
jgi:hypothetical protein